jgi:hypothetical protein
MPQANSNIITHHDAGVIVLADWRAANKESRREMAARNFAPANYDPTIRVELERDLMRISSEVRAIGQELKAGSINARSASVVLNLIHDDLFAASCRAAKLDRKLAKAKRKAKKRAR